LLPQNDFLRCLRDLRINISEEQGQLIFQLFDRDGSGRVEYDEFLRVLRGELSDFRKGLVYKAF
jgi:Ca2+-binding EF-hand superfamily protein